MIYEFMMVQTIGTISSFKYIILLIHYMFTIGNYVTKYKIQVNAHRSCTAVTS